MSIIRGEALTPDALRVMRRLCRHWSHKFAVEFDEQSGLIQLDETRLTMRVLPDRLALQLENAAEVPGRLPGVVTAHLQRMAGVEPPLEVRWEAPATGAAMP